MTEDRLRVRITLPSTATIDCVPVFEGDELVDVEDYEIVFMLGLVDATKAVLVSAVKRAIEKLEDGDLRKRSTQALPMTRSIGSSRKANNKQRISDGNRLVHRRNNPACAVAASDELGGRLMKPALISHTRRTVMGEKETRSLKVKLAQDQVAERGIMLAETSKKLADEEAARLASMQKHKAIIGGLKENMKELVAAVTEAEDFAEVECTWTPDYDTHMMELIRDDTGEVVESRSMAYEEQQLDVEEMTAQEIEDEETQPVTRLRKKPGDNGDDD